MDLQQVSSDRTSGVTESQNDYTASLSASPAWADGPGIVRDSIPGPASAAPGVPLVPSGSQSPLETTSTNEALEGSQPLDIQYKSTLSQFHTHGFPASARYDEDEVGYEASSASTSSLCSSDQADSVARLEVTQASSFGLGPLDEDAQERRAQIEESDVELLVGLGPLHYRLENDADLSKSCKGFSNSLGTSCSDDRRRVNFAPIKGRGLPNPNLLNVQLLSTTPSDITDLGHHQWASRHSQGPAQSLPPQVKETPSLREKIHQSLITNYQASSKGFLPKGAIDALITEDSVRQELTRRRPKQSAKFNSVQDIVRQVCRVQAPELGYEQSKSRRARSFRNIFAILVVAKKPSAIRRFLKEGVSDADLPLAKIPRPNLQNVFDLRRESEKDVPLRCFRGWDSIEILDFEEWQWMTLSPFFAKGARKDVKHYLLQERIILPFTSDSRKQNTDVEHGGNSQVFKVDIHPGHHDFHEGKMSRSSFAIKHLNSRDKSHFKEEVEMLKKFSNDSHQHLISLLATYEQFNCYYLIFPWADADLLGFWQKIKPNPTFDHDTVKWVAQQCRGIASGLARIHDHVTTSDMEEIRLYGRHGDIKPENILWFSDPTNDSDKGTLKITDFGSAEFNSHESGSRKRGQEISGFSLSYCPPECLLGDRVIRRSYDIWSLACVYLMFITWLLGGRTLLRQFARCRCRMGEREPNHPEIQADAFFEKIMDDGKGYKVVVNSAVTKFIDDLRKHPNCSEFIHEFLEMVMEEMLVIEDAEQTNRRISSLEVHFKLDKMYKECDKSKEYATGPGNVSREEP